MHKNVVKFCRVVSEICERTDRQTDRLITILGARLGGEVLMRYIATRATDNAVAILAMVTVTRSRPLQVLGSRGPSRIFPRDAV